MRAVLIPTLAALALGACASDDADADAEHERSMLSRWQMVEVRTGTPVGPGQWVVLELPKYDASQPPQTPVETWASFFREAGTLTTVPAAFAQPPFVDALEAARTARFTAAEWEAYVRAGVAIQKERGAPATIEQRGR